MCIANYNGEDYLQDCLNSVLSQNFDKPIEIIVHDDASTDGSVQLLKDSYPSIIIIKSKENAGFCVSNNRMVSIARGKFILLLNNDAKLHTDAISTLYNASIENGDGIYGLPQYDMHSDTLIDMGCFLDPFLNPVPNKDPQYQDVGMIIGACLWIPRSLWNFFGGFPDWFGSIAEDMYLCLIARLSGYNVKVVPYSGFDHWIGKSFGGGRITSQNKLSTKISRRAISERNKTYVMLICCPSPIIFLIFPLHILNLIGEGTVLSIVKQKMNIWTDVYLRCFIEVWKQRKRIYHLRKSVQETRQCSLKEFFKHQRWLPYKLSMLIKHGMPQVNP